MYIDAKSAETMKINNLALVTRLDRILWHDLRLFLPRRVKGNSPHWENTAIYKKLVFLSMW